jgi:hypothetical protein
MAFDWYHDFDVATISRANDGLLELGRVAYSQTLDLKSTRMIQALQTIYNRLYQPNPRSYDFDDLHTSQVLRYLEIKEQVNSQDDYYRQLAVEICKLKTPTFSPVFIERFCLAKLSAFILAEYELNVAAAYALAYVTLNKPTDLNNMYFKLGTSGLLGPTTIKNEKITDVEAISGFIISSLREAELLSISDGRWLKPGKKFILMM